MIGKTDARPKVCVVLADVILLLLLLFSLFFLVSRMRRRVHTTSSLRRSFVSLTDTNGFYCCKRKYIAAKITFVVTVFSNNSDILLYTCQMC